MAFRDKNGQKIVCVSMSESDRGAELMRASAINDETRGFPPGDDSLILCAPTGSKRAASTEQQSLGSRLRVIDVSTKQETAWSLCLRTALPIWTEGLEKYN